MFSHNGRHVASGVRRQYRRERRAEASSQNFQRIRQRAPNCDFVVLYSGINCERGAKSALYDCFVMAALCNRGAIIFLPCDFYLSIYLSVYLLLFYPSPNLSGRRLDVYHTLTHGVTLVRI